MSDSITRLGRPRAIPEIRDNARDPEILAFETSPPPDVLPARDHERNYLGVVTPPKESESFQAERALSY